MIDVEVHDMRHRSPTPTYNFIGVLQFAVVPRIGETVHLSEDDSGFVVKAVLHVPGKPPQVRGW